MSSGLIFDEIIMNIFRNKLLEFHMEGVNRYFTKTDNEKKYMYRGGQLKTFTIRKALMKVLMLYVQI